MLCGRRHQTVIQHYPPLSLADERRLIALAQAGSAFSTQELVLRHIGVIVFRMQAGDVGDDSDVFLRGLEMKWGSESRQGGLQTFGEHAKH